LFHWRGGTGVLCGAELLLVYPAQEQRAPLIRDQSTRLSKISILPKYFYAAKTNGTFESNIEIAAFIALPVCFHSRTEIGGGSSTHQ